MKRRRLLNSSSLLLLCPFLLHSTPSQAQGRDFPGQIFGSVGWGRFSDDEGSLGDGVNLGGGIAVRLFSGVWLELEVNAMKHLRQFPFPSGVRFEGTDILVSGNLVYHVSDSVYVVGGVGSLHSNRSSTFPMFVLDPESGRRSEGPPEVFEFIDTELAYNFGAGGTVAATSKVSLRPEVRWFVSTPSNLNLIRASLGVVYDW